MVAGPEGPAYYFSAPFVGGSFRARHHDDPEPGGRNFPEQSTLDMERDTGTMTHTLDQTFGDVVYEYTHRWRAHAG
jgi:hypothetical protein